MDDVIFTIDDTDGITYLKRHFINIFEMKDLGILNYFFGFVVSYNSDGYFLTQTKYAMDILARTVV